MIIADLTLPDARGIDAVQRLRACAPAPPLVVMSALDDPELASATLKMGAQDFLVKGRFDEELLTRALRYAQERKNIESRLLELTDRDELTSLPNRSSLFRRLKGPWMEGGQRPC